MSDAAHPHSESSEIQSRLIVLYGVIFTLILVVLLIWLRDYFYVVRNEITEKKVFELTNPELIRLRAQEDATLGTYGWVDKDKGIVRIPIQRAMDLLVKEDTLRTASAPEGEPR